MFGAGFRVLGVIRSWVGLIVDSEFMPTRWPGRGRSRQRRTMVAITIAASVHETESSCTRELRSPGWAVCPSKFRPSRMHDRPMELRGSRSEGKNEHARTVQRPADWLHGVLARDRSGELAQATSRIPPRSWPHTSPPSPTGS